MSATDNTPEGSASEADLRAELERLEAEGADLLRRAYDVRAEISTEGPSDAIDRATLLTEAEELEAFAAELERRRDSLAAKLKATD
jgi:hypothetical protein